MTDKFNPLDNKLVSKKVLLPKFNIARFNKNFNLGDEGNDTLYIEKISILKNGVWQYDTYIKRNRSISKKSVIDFVKKLENPDYYIQDFQRNTVYLSDLYFKRYELYAELEIDILSCNDLRKTLNILSEILNYSDDELSEKFWDEKDVFKNKHEKANRLALKNCK